MSKTFVSWAVVLLVTGALAWHYAGRPNLFSRFTTPIDATGDNDATLKPRKKTRAKKDGGPDEKLPSEASTEKNSGLGAVDASSGKKRKIASKTPAKSVSVSNIPAMGKKDEEDGANNVAFAEQFVKARAGTPLNKPSGDRLSKKDRRANKARIESASASPNVSTEPSSTTGAEDADDDMSPIVSPSGASGLDTLKSGDVADMLEPAKGGPNVIRLTGDLESSQKKSQPKAYQVAESKKKRQARLKREQQKLEVAAAEAARKQLEERQLRSARMAAGTSNQVKVDAFQPVTNAWTQKSQAQAPSIVSDQQHDIPLLDTFDTEPLPNAATNGADLNKAETNGTSKDQQNGSVGIKPKDTNSPWKASQENSLEGRDTDSSKNQQNTHPELAGGNATKNAPAGPPHAANTPQVTQKQEPSQKPVEPAPSKENIAPGQKVMPQSGSEQEEKLSWADDLPTEEEQLRRLRASEDEWNTVSSKRDKKRTARKQPESGTNSKGDVSNDGTGAELSKQTANKQTAAVRQPATNNGNGFASLALPTDSQLNDSDWEA